MRIANFLTILLRRSKIADIAITLVGSLGNTCIACVVVVVSVAGDASSDVIRLPTRTVALSGQSAPGVEGASFRHFSSPALNTAGQTAFGASLVVGGNVDSTNDSGTWSEGSGRLSLIAREGSPAPGTAGARYSDFTPASFEFNSLPAINNAGQTVFRRFLQTGGDVNRSNDVGLWSEGSGNLSLVSRESSVAPGTGGAHFGGGTGGYPFIEDPVINDAGQTAFRGLLQTRGAITSSNDSGIWSEGSGTLALVAREGSVAAGTGGARFRELQKPAINGVGQTAFLAVLRTGGSVDSSNNSGIWSEGLGTLALVAREGSPAPGTDGVNFGDFLFSSPVINGAGQTAFLARLEGGDAGIWAEDRSGVLRKVVRNGDLLEVADGDFRTISSIDFASDSGNEDGRRSGFND